MLRLIPLILMLASAFACSAKNAFTEAFWEDSNFYAFRVSPGGRFVSYMEQDGLISRLHVRDFETNKAYSLDSERDGGFGSYVWVNDETIALLEYANTAGQSVRSYISTYDYRLKRQKADFNRPSRLSMGSNHKDIVPQILSGVPTQPDFMLIAQPTASFYSNPGRTRSDFSRGRTLVHRMDVRTGDIEQLVDNPEFDLWLPDSQGRLRLALKVFGENEGVYYRSTEKDEWRLLNLPEGALSPGFMTGDENILISYRPEESDKIILQAYDPETGKWASQPISDDLYDIVDGGGELPSLQRDPATYNVLGIHFDKEKASTIWLDPTYAQVEEILKKQFPGAVVSIKGFVKPIDSVLVEVYSDIMSPVVLFYNIKEPGLQLFMDKKPSIKDFAYNKIQPVTFTARDGETVHAYLTLPEDWSEKSPPPMAVVVKGGPMGRTTWANGVEIFEAQWLSGMGCAVLQVNYRGSTGYGAEYSGEDTSESMLYAAQKGVEDVVDGTRWAIENGYADKENIILMGASFGGYVSGMAPAVEPDLYKITIPAMGVYDWLGMVEYDQEESHPFVWDVLKDRYGDYEELAPEYRKWSPAEHTDKIRIPMLLMAGIYDARVDMEQAKLYERALKRANVDFETYHYTRGGHGFSDQDGWVDYFDKIEEFIKRYIPLK